MKSLLFSLVICTLFTSTLDAQSDCATATPITPPAECAPPTIITGTTVGETASGLGTCTTTASTGGVFWYSFTGDGGTYEANTCTNTSFNTKIWIFEGACGSLNCVDGNDDFCGLQSSVTFLTVPGLTYYVIVGGLNADEGAYEMSLSNIDVTPPTMTCQDITVQLDGTGNASIVLGDILSQGPATTLYFTNTDGNVSSASTDGTGTPTLLYNSGSNAVGIDHDPLADDLYWSRGNIWDITTASADGLGTPVDLPNSNGQPNEHLDVDLDPANARHFFTTGNGSGIYTALMDGSGSATLLYDLGGNVNSVDYNPTNDKVYFTGISNSEIHGMDANGSNESVLFDNVDGVDSPRGIITDATKIYWINQSGNVMSGNIDGTGTPVVLYTGSTPYHIDLDEASGMLFWGEHGNTGDIFTAPADGSGSPVLVYSGLGTDLRGIALGAVGPGVPQDNCGTATGTIDISTFDCADIGTPVTVTVTAIDGSGNISTCTSTVTVEDTLAPVIDIPVLADVISSCDITPPVVTATDNCDGILNGTPDVSFPITAAGTTTVTWTYTDASGNSSSQTQDVIITPIDVNVSMQPDNITIAANNFGQIYQWIDCNTGQAIPGATDFTYVTTYGSDFAVIIWQNGCSDTSACVNSTVGIDDLQLEAFGLYPNPTKGKFTINYEGNIQNIEVIDMMGRIVQAPTNLIEKSVDGTHLEAGKYIVQITTLDDQIIQGTVVIQK